MRTKKETNTNRIPECTSDKVFRVVSAIALGLFFLIVTYPLYFTLIASVSELNAIKRGEVMLWPKGLQFISYQRVFQNSQILDGYRNTLFYTVVGTLINLCVTLTGGYALSNKFPGKKVIMFLIIFTMYFSGGLIPTYFTYKHIGILNEVWVMLLPGAVSAYNLIITRTFISAIPGELWEAAEIDGCSQTRYFFSIVIPLSTVLISVLTLFCAVTHWNSYFNAMMFLSNRPELHPLQLILREILTKNSVPIADATLDSELANQMRQIKELLKYSLIVVSSLPMLILYPFLQKYFIKGVMIGSVKG